MSEAVAPVRARAGQPPQRALRRGCSDARKASSCSRVNRRWPPGVRRLSRWPASDQRRTVEIETPRCCAACATVSPRGAGGRVALSGMVRQPTARPRGGASGDDGFAQVRWAKGAVRAIRVQARAPTSAQREPANRDAGRQQADAHQDQDRRPDAGDPPVERASALRARSDRGRGRHRAREVARVAGADEDPVEREHDRARTAAAARTSARSRAISLEHVGVAGERARDDAAQDREQRRRSPGRRPATDSSTSRRPSARASRASPEPRARGRPAPARRSRARRGRARGR